MHRDETPLNFYAVGEQLFKRYLRMADKIVQYFESMDVLVIYKGSYAVVWERRNVEVQVADNHCVRVPLYTYYSSDMRQRVNYFRAPIPVNASAMGVCREARRLGFENVRIKGNTVYLFKVVN